MLKLLESLDCCPRQPTTGLFHRAPVVVNRLLTSQDASFVAYKECREKSFGAYPNGWSIPGPCWLYEKNRLVS